MSANTKKLLIIVVVAFFVCIVGAAVAVGGLGLAADRLKNNLATDPEKVHAMASEFISYQVPPGYTEQMGMDFFIYKMIILTDSDSPSLQYASKPSIILTHFQQTEGMTPEQMTEQMQKSFEQQSSQKGLDFKLVETRKVTINGQEATLNVNEGTDSSGEAFRQWVTNFPGKTGGLVILMVQGKTADWDDELLNNFLASIGN